MCIIRRGSQLERLITAATLIIIDESTMLHRHIFEALDRSLRDLMKRPNDIFGGIAVVLSGIITLAFLKFIFKYKYLFSACCHSSTND